MFSRKVTISIILLLIIQAFNLMASAKTEEQKYRIVHSENEFEIRFYPSTILATVYSSANSYKELSWSGFRKLAGYIFGGNETKTKISMTSPVHMDINDSGSSMSFVMPSSYHMENLPKPDDAGVVLETSKDEYVAVLKFKGYASDKTIKEYTEKLRRLLNRQSITFKGNFRFLGYDPPYRVFNRRNEIIVSVQWSESK
jgi:SOUL heme-binding protein